jgi:ubiquinone/menaquinone biosynthesis C-methylase UbiE
MRPIRGSRSIAPDTSPYRSLEMAEMTTSDRSTSEHDWHSRDYVDWWITRDQSRDAERRQRLRAMLGHAGIAADSELSVIDIGGGYGVVAEEVVAAFPRARVTVQDYSEPMLLVARERLIAHSGRINFVLADLTDRRWVDRVLGLGGGPFDLAVSAIVIHNLRQRPLIADAYRGVASVLKPGALFLDYDLFFDEVGGLEGNTQMLHEAGFSRVDCLWQQRPLATIAAQKAA